MKRRQFIKLAGMSTAVLGSRWVPALGSMNTPTLYYVDGYHGGIKGHMPAGAWRDVLNVMQVLAEWKISLEIEPVSWAALKQEDPKSYNQLKTYLQNTASDARVEMLSVTFAQPYGWAIGGESNIRQLMRGLELTRAHFPQAPLKTYAVQEPCWASCLPQILRSLGFEQAVLKNPGTAWGGYSAGINAETVRWIGPDGTAIPAAPRYACEELVNAWETESVNGTPEFSRKCVANGIAHPAGMCFQDLGWRASPRASGDHIRYVTWHEYFDRIVDEPKQNWAFGIEDILVTLPWGQQTIQKIAQQVRKAETQLLVAEKLSALAWLHAGRRPNASGMEAAWDDLMWSQHHDVWITATTRSGREAWAFLADSWTLNAETVANAEIDEGAAALLSSGQDSAQASRGEQSLRILNTLARGRNDLVEVTIAADRGTRGIRVLDDRGQLVPCQIIPRRRYSPLKVGAPFDEERKLPESFDQESLNTATLLFRATAPALGYTTYRIETVTEPNEASANTPVSAQAEDDGSVVLENDLYRLRLDPKRGGAVTSLYLKKSGQQVTAEDAERLFNEYRGYFIERKEWCSSADSTAKISIQESGPVRATVRVEGTVGDAKFRTDISLAAGQPWIDFQARLSYEKQTWIGDPWDIAPQNRRTERRKSHHDGQWKLQAFFPMRCQAQSIYKNAAYDVCQSRHENTFFQRWDEIKHTIVQDWVDAVDEREDIGLAVFSDHTTAYSHGPDHPLALVLAWGAEAGFWWGKQPLDGTQEIHYGVVPHAGRWDSAHICEMNNRWKEPLLARAMTAPTRRNAQRFSFIEASQGIEIPTVLVEDGHLLVRVFNAESSNSQHSISFGTRPTKVELVELDGRRIKQLPLPKGTNGRTQVSLAIPRFGIRTLRCEYNSSRR